MNHTYGTNEPFARDDAAQSLRDATNISPADADEIAAHVGSLGWSLSQYGAIWYLHPERPMLELEHPFLGDDLDHLNHSYWHARLEIAMHPAWHEHSRAPVMTQQQMMNARSRYGLARTDMELAESEAMQAYLTAGFHGMVGAILRDVQRQLRPLTRILCRSLDDLPDFNKDLTVRVMPDSRTDNYLIRALQAYTTGWLRQSWTLAALAYQSRHTIGAEIEVPTTVEENRRMVCFYGYLAECLRHRGELSLERLDTMELATQPENLEEDPVWNLPPPTPYEEPPRHMRGNDPEAP